MQVGLGPLTTTIPLSMSEPGLKWGCCHDLSGGSMLIWFRSMEPLLGRNVTLDDSESASQRLGGSMICKTACSWRY